MENNVIFIDFENLQHIDSNLLKPNTEIVVLVGLNQNDLSIKFIKQNMDNVSSIKLIKVKASGSNALDFFIAYYLGFYIKENKNKCFIIVSNDGGYDALIRHLSENEISIKRFGYKQTGDILEKKMKKDKTIEEEIVDKSKRVIEQIKKEKGPKPSTLKGLKKRIKKIFSGDISDDNILEVVNYMKTNKNIEINKEKVSYKK
jgi:hypothetical protein